MVANVTPAEVWRALEADPTAQIVDVRSDAEWTFVGLPDLSALGRQVVTIAWQVFPGMQLNDGFLVALREAGCAPQHALFFLCRSGARSMSAARAAAAAGYLHTYNIADGFEGPCDGDGHRGTVAGWKAAGLPWRQR